ncbi:phosphoglucomutase/phosphomannomutase family protein [Anaerocolumna xylanovorans]
MLSFGTGGWRAIIGDEFTRDNISSLAQAIADYIKNQADQREALGFVIGYDRRFLSQKAAVWMSEVMAANGLTVYFIKEVAPTPLIMYTILSSGLEYGIAVTASHNSSDYNGVKLFVDGGKDATQDITDQVEVNWNRLKQKDIKRMEYDEALRLGRIQITDPFNSYIDNILSSIELEKIKERRLKILIDPMYGVSRTCLAAVLVSARCQVDVINDRHDPLFGGRLPSPSANTLNKLKDMVVERNYDLGVATDGDADRLGIVDEKGNFIHPNDILVLLYYYLLEYKKLRGSVVRNIATTHLLDRIAIDHGQVCYEVPVGFKHISSAMEEHQAIIGGESSGGLTINGRIRGKDGIFAAALMAELISVAGKNISGLLEEIHERYGRLWSEERDYSFSEKRKKELYRLLFEEKKLPAYSEPVKHISYLDGVKIYFENDGWIIVRFSGTEPVLRIFSEMESKEEAYEAVKQMEEFLQLNQIKATA